MGTVCSDHPVYESQKLVVYLSEKGELFLRPPKELAQPERFTTIEPLEYKMASSNWRDHAVKGHKERPNVGDTVVLNDYGLETCFGFASGLQHMKTKRMKLTKVARESMTDDAPSYIVEVDDPEINELLLIHWCFDVVEKAV